MSNIHGEHIMHSSEMETYTVKSIHWEMQTCTLLMAHKYSMHRVTVKAGTQERGMERGTEINDRK